MLVLRPIGRGNWKPVYVQIDGVRNGPRPLEFHIGERIPLGGQVFRVVRIQG